MYGPNKLYKCHGIAVTVTGVNDSDSDTESITAVHVRTTDCWTQEAMHVLAEEPDHAAARRAAVA